MCVYNISDVYILGHSHTSMHSCFQIYQRIEMKQNTCSLSEIISKIGRNNHRTDKNKTNQQLLGEKRQGCWKNANKLGSIVDQTRQTHKSNMCFFYYLFFLFFSNLFSEFHHFTAFGSE